MGSSQSSPRFFECPASDGAGGTIDEVDVVPVGVVAEVSDEVVNGLVIVVGARLRCSRRVTPAWRRERDRLDVRCVS